MEDTPVELESFMKDGLKLLRRTNDPDSINQMLKHLEDAMQEKYGTKRRPTNAAKNLPLPDALLSKQLSIEQTEGIGEDESSSSSSSSIPITTISKSIEEVCLSSPPTDALEQAKADEVIIIDSDSEVETDVESYCFVCKDSFVNIGNSLVECLDCLHMYHQNCHIPPITDIDVNDPRVVWYCGNCRQKDVEKADSRVSRKKSKKSSSKSSKEDKSSSSAKASSSKSKSSSANKNKKHYPTTSGTMMSAVKKRVQMMNKKQQKK